MQLALRVVLCGCLALGAGLAQRHGGGMGGGMGGGFRGGGGGGFRGGGFVGGGGFRGGGFVGGGGFRGGGFVGGGGFRGGFVGGGFRGFHNGFRGRFIGFGGLGFGYWPGYYGYGYGYPSYDYGYDPYAYSYPAYSYPSNAYPAYSAGYASQPASNVTVVYPPQQNTAPPNLVIREYDQYGQEVRRAPEASNNGPAGSPIYLIAFKDHSIRVAAAYWLDGNTLHYITLERQQQQVSLESVDRDLSMQLNRERHVAFSLTR